MPPQTLMAMPAATREAATTTQMTQPHSALPANFSRNVFTRSPSSWTAPAVTKPAPLPQAMRTRGGTCSELCRRAGASRTRTSECCLSLALTFFASRHQPTSASSIGTRCVRVLVCACVLVFVFFPTHTSPPSSSLLCVCVSVCLSLFLSVPLSLSLSLPLSSPVFVLFFGGCVALAV